MSKPARLPLLTIATHPGPWLPICREEAALGYTVRVCAWCQPAAEVYELSRMTNISHGLCETHKAEMLAESRL